MNRPSSPLRVWSYRNWSWLCRLHPGSHGTVKASGWGCGSWTLAMAAAELHWREHHGGGAR